MKYVISIILSLVIIVVVSVGTVSWMQKQGFFDMAVSSGDTVTATDMPDISEDATEPEPIHQLPPDVQDNRYEEFEATNGTFDRVKASSYADWQGTKGLPSWAFDADANTTWQDGVKDGYGEGEWFLSYNADGSTRTISSVTVYNGYQDLKYNNDAQNFYQLNSRVKDIMLEFDDGSVYVFTLADSPEAQTFSFDEPVETCYVKLTVESVYQGKWSDTCLSEIVYR